MLKTLKESLKLFDYFILIAAVIMFTSFDYGNLRLTDKIYMVSFIIWIVLLIVRIYIIHQGGQRK